MPKDAVRRRFNRACRAILNENDQNPDPESRDRVRSAVLTNIQDLRRLVEELLDNEVSLDDDGEGLAGY